MAASAAQYDSVERMISPRRIKSWGSEGDVSERRLVLPKLQPSALAVKAQIWEAEKALDRSAGSLLETRAAAAVADAAFLIP